MPVPGTSDQRILGNIAGSDTGIRHSCYRLSLAGWKLSGNSQLEPDIKVANSPETVVKGEDTQLKAAVDELLKEIDGK